RNVTGVQTCALPISFALAVRDIFIMQALCHSENPGCRLCGVFMTRRDRSCGRSGCLLERLRLRCWYRWCFGFSFLLWLNNGKVCCRGGCGVVSVASRYRGRDRCFFTGLSFKLSHLTP